MRKLFQTAMVGLVLAAFDTGLRAADTTGTASVTVHVPVGATLNINDQPTHQMTAVRLFVTPPLPVGKRFKYNLIANYTWRGEEVTKRTSVEVTAGATVRVDMTEGETVVKPSPPVPEVKPEPEPKPKPEPKPEKKPEPKPEPKKPEKKPEPKKPEPKVEKAKPKKKPEPKPEPARPKPLAANVEPQRAQAPPPREVKPKKGK